MNLHKLTLELKIRITRYDALELTYERAFKILKEYNFKSRKEYYVNLIQDYQKIRVIILKINSIPG